jgi:hypothetical protein
MFMLLYAGGTEFVFHTMVTAGAAAFATGLNTVFAEVLTADLAAAGTTQADCVVAHRTVGGTVVAVIVATLDTGVPVFPVHLPTAVITGHPIPILQPDIGTVGVVGPKDTQHHAEKVKQSAVTQGRTNSGRAVPFAQMPPADMGVGHILRRGGRMGIQGDHRIGDPAGDLREPKYVQPDLELAQMNIVQGDGFRGDAEVFIHLVKSDGTEFLLDLVEFGEDILHRGNAWFLAVQVSLEIGGQPRQVIDRSLQAIAADSRGQEPAMGHGLFQKTGTTGQQLQLILEFAALAHNLTEGIDP